MSDPQRPLPVHGASRAPPNPRPPRARHRGNAKELPGTVLMRLWLFLTFAIYCVLGALCILALTKGGHRWDGDADTLTWILAGIGAGFTILSRLLIAQCQEAGLQSAGALATGEGISIGDLHKMDIAVRGPAMSQFKGAASFSGWTYRFVLPALTIITSAIAKKAFGPDIKDTTVPITGYAASLVDPVDVSTGIQGTSFPGAIVYNITSSTGTKPKPNETSWTYMLADSIDPTGLRAVNYYMPNLPVLVSEGTSGYVNYSAETVPILAAKVQCSAGTSISEYQGSILNSNNNITISTIDGTAWIQVMSVTNTVWSCFADIGTTMGTINFSSDDHGNWNISSVENLQSMYMVPFSTTPARMNMIADIISDALGTTASYSGWDWNSGTPTSAAYSMMLATTRLSFGAATLGFSNERAPRGPQLIPGEASQTVEEVALFNNWALKFVTALLFIQALFALSHLFTLGEFKIDFGILQIMEMTSAGAKMPGDEDHSVVLEGHCSQYRDDLVETRQVAIRENEQGNKLHLALVDPHHGDPYIVRNRAYL